jgi:hypothetical protein
MAFANAIAAQRAGIGEDEIARVVGTHRSDDPYCTPYYRELVLFQRDGWLSSLEIIDYTGIEPLTEFPELTEFERLT